METLPDGWTTAAPWLAAIRAAREEPDLVLANLTITRLHHLLSLALGKVIGQDRARRG